jgi:hypothetical protein
MLTAANDKVAECQNGYLILVTRNPKIGILFRGVLFRSPLCGKSCNFCYNGTKSQVKKGALIKIDSSGNPLMQPSVPSCLEPQQAG